MADSIFDAVVVGAGIHGLCAAQHLRARGLERIVVTERFAADHARGSSHGVSRILRSSYHDALYVQLARAARETAWPELLATLGVAGLTPVRGVFFGSDRPRFRSFVQTTLAHSRGVEEIDAASARRQFPLLRFADDHRVLVDHTAGVLAADGILAGLRAWLTAHGVEFWWSTGVSAVASEVDAVLLATERGTLRARRVVLACGAWASTLVPELAARCTVLRQTVGYYELDAQASACRAPAFPVWARIGEAVNDFVYGLPASPAGGVKLARHRTEGAADDRDIEVRTAPGAALADLAQMAPFAFAVGARLVRSETCLYTMTADQHFVVDALARDRRIVVVSACSGHGFKFGPVIGALVRAILLDGATPPAAFLL